MSQFLQSITGLQSLQHSRRSPIGNAPAPRLDESAVLETAEAGKVLPPRVVILTALSEEFLAVEQHVVNRKELRHPDGTVYKYGQFTPGVVVWDVLIVETGQGNRRAANETQRAIGYFKPDLVLFVGVAGGRKDVKIGDVVVDDKVYNYESGRDEIEFKCRPEAERSSYPLEQEARVIVRNWLRRKQEPGTEEVPAAHIGAIAAGESVVASTQSTIAQRLNQNYGDALAVEKEGYGFLGAAREIQNTPALVIRGISDLLDDKENSDRQGSQRLAARHASEFAFELLENLAGEKNDQPELYDPQDTTSLSLYATLPEGMIGMTIGISFENFYYVHAYHLKDVFLGRKRNINKSLLELNDQMEKYLDNDDKLSLVSGCNAQVKKSDDCIVGELLGWLQQQAGYLSNMAKYLVIDHQIEVPIPWEMLNVGRNPIGVIFQTARQRQVSLASEQASPCCDGEILAYAHENYQGWQSHRQKKFTRFQEFLAQVQNPTAEFGLIFIDGFSFETPLKKRLDIYLEKSKLLQNRASIVFVSGQIELDASVEVTYQMLLTNFLDHGAKGVVGVSRSISLEQAKVIVDRFAEEHRQHPGWTVPEILRQLRFQAWEAVDNVVNEKTCSDYLATFSHIYHGDPLIPLRLAPENTL